MAGAAHRQHGGGRCGERSIDGTSEAVAAAAAAAPTPTEQGVGHTGHHTGHPPAPSERETLGNHALREHAARPLLVLLVLVLVRLLVLVLVAVLVATSLLLLLLLLLLPLRLLLHLYRRLLEHRCRVSRRLGCGLRSRTRGGGPRVSCRVEERLAGRRRRHRKLAAHHQRARGAEPGLAQRRLHRAFGQEVRARHGRHEEDDRAARTARISHADRARLLAQPRRLPLEVLAPLPRNLRRLGVAEHVRRAPWPLRWHLVVAPPLLLEEPVAHLRERRVRAEGVAHCTLLRADVERRARALLGGAAGRRGLRDGLRLQGGRSSGGRLEFELALRLVLLQLTENTLALRGLLRLLALERLQVPCSVRHERERARFFTPSRSFVHAI